MHLFPNTLHTVAKALHAVSLLPLLWLLYVNFMLVVVTILFSESNKPSIEVLLWTIPASLLLGQWIWTGVFLWGPRVDGTVPLPVNSMALVSGFAWAAAAGSQVLFSDGDFERAYPFYAVPTALIPTISLAALWILREQDYNLPLFRRSLAASSLLCPLSVVCALKLMAVGDPSDYYLLPVLITWFAISLTMWLRPSLAQRM